MESLQEILMATQEKMCKENSSKNSLDNFRWHFWRNISWRHPQKLPKRISQEVFDGIPQPISAEIHKWGPGEISKRVLKKIHKINEAVSDEIIGWTPEVISWKNLQWILWQGEIPRRISEEICDGIPQWSPQGFSQGILQRIPWEISQEIPKGISERNLWEIIKINIFLQIHSPGIPLENFQEIILEVPPGVPLDVPQGIVRGIASDLLKLCFFVRFFFRESLRNYSRIYSSEFLQEFFKKLL